MRSSKTTAAFLTSQVHGASFLLYHYVHSMMSVPASAQGRVKGLKHVLGEGFGCIPNTVEFNQSSILQSRTLQNYWYLSMTPGAMHVLLTVCFNFQPCLESVNASFATLSPSRSYAYHSDGWPSSSEPATKLYRERRESENAQHSRMAAVE